MSVILPRLRQGLFILLVALPGILLYFMDTYGYTIALVMSAPASCLGNHTFDFGQSLCAVQYSSTHFCPYFTLFMLSEAIYTFHTSYKVLKKFVVIKKHIAAI